MKKNALSVALLLGAAMLAPVSAAQEIRAITEDGRKVVLTPDGKWRFDNRAKAGGAAPADTGGSPYQTSVRKISLSFNAAEWSMFPKREGEAHNKRMLQHKSLPIYAMVIADEIPATTEALKNIIFTNAESGGFTTTTLVDQLKPLSGKQVGELRFLATNKGVEFIFSSHYYADEDGNVQLMCYTAQSLFHKYQADCEKLLNGLVIK